MNKAKARKIALEGRLTVGDLRAKIAEARSIGGMSAVNPSIPRERTLNIYEAALAGRDDGETPAVWRPDPYSKTGAMKPTLDVMLITNILRDTARAALRSAKGE